jgi:hypothetical protein
MCKISLQIFEIGILNAAANFIGLRLKPRNLKAQRDPDDILNLDKCEQTRQNAYLSFSSENHRKIRLHKGYQGVCFSRSARFAREKMLRQHVLFKECEYTASSSYLLRRSRLRLRMS